MEQAFDNTGISVVIPAFNSAHRLERLIPSFLEINSYPLFELIVIDHESSDNTSNIVATYASRAVIRFISRPKNYSFPDACAFGTQKAHYPFVLFLPSHINYTEDVLPAVLDRLIDHTISAVGVIWHDGSLLSDSSSNISAAGSSSSGRRLTMSEMYYSKITSSCTAATSFPITPVTCVVFRKNTLHHITGKTFQNHSGHDTRQACVDFMLYLTNRLHRVCWYVNGRWDEHFHALTGPTCSCPDNYEHVKTTAPASEVSGSQHPEIPIVVVAYNRPNALMRLLHSLDVAHYDRHVQLFISVDGGDNAGVVKMAKEFRWRHGAKSVITHKTNTGLKAHVVKCSDLAMEFDGVVILEDDLLVSPFFYHYVQQAFNVYRHDDQIAGISLYAHHYNETAQLPFKPIYDNSDVFFMQVPASWGVVWSASQWAGFKKWLKKYTSNGTEEIAIIPDNVISWPHSSWKKDFSIYISETNKFFVYPRTSLSTNFGDTGVHMFTNKVYQRFLQYGKKNYVFLTLSDSLASYDSYCEILPKCLSRLCPVFQNYQYCVDLYGLKAYTAMKGNYILTSKKVTDYVCSFGKEIIPLEGNILHGVKGESLRFSRIDALADIKSYEELKKEYIHSDNILYHYSIEDWVLKATFDQ